MAKEEWYFKNETPESEREVLKQHVEYEMVKNFDTDALRTSEQNKRLGLKNNENAKIPEFADLEVRRVQLKNELIELEKQQELSRILADAYEHTAEVFRQKWNTLYEGLRAKRPKNSVEQEALMNLQNEIDAISDEGDRTWKAYQSELKKCEKIFDEHAKVFDKLLALDLSNAVGEGEVDFSKN